MEIVVTFFPGYIIEYEVRDASSLTLQKQDLLGIKNVHGLPQKQLRY